MATPELRCLADEIDLTDVSPEGNAGSSSPRCSVARAGSAASAGFISSFAALQPSVLPPPSAGKKNKKNKGPRQLPPVELAAYLPPPSVTHPPEQQQQQQRDSSPAPDQDTSSVTPAAAEDHIATTARGPSLAAAPGTPALSAAAADHTEAGPRDVAGSKRSFALSAAEVEQVSGAEDVQRSLRQKQQQSTGEQTAAVCEPQQQKQQQHSQPQSAAGQAPAFTSSRPFLPTPPTPAAAADLLPGRCDRSQAQQSVKQVQTRQASSSSTVPVGPPAEQFKNQQGGSCSSLPRSMPNSSGNSPYSGAGMLAAWQQQGAQAAGVCQQQLLAGLIRGPTGVGQQLGSPGSGCAAASGGAPVMFGRMPPPPPPPPPPRQPHLAGTAGTAGTAGVGVFGLQYNTNLLHQGMMVMMAPDQAEFVAPPAPILQPGGGGGAAVFRGPATAGWGDVCMGGPAGAGSAQGVYQQGQMMPGAPSLQGQWGRSSRAAAVAPAAAQAAAPWQASGANLQGQWGSQEVMVPPPATSAPQQRHTGRAPAPASSVSKHVAQMVGRPRAKRKSAAAGPRPDATGARPSTTARVGGAPVKQVSKLAAAAQGRVPWYKLGQI